MALEIERKFLVKGDYKKEACRYESVMQGYISSHPERSVRVRLKGDKAYLTIKGISNDAGVTRYEWEKEIAVAEARELMRLCEPGVINKNRYYVESGEHVFEVDEFLDENQGLVVAEIELTSEDETFIRPSWLGDEVTNDNKYYNASLVKHPYSKW